LSKMRGKLLSESGELLIVTTSRHVPRSAVTLG